MTKAKAFASGFIEHVASDRDWDRVWLDRPHLDRAYKAGRVTGELVRAVFGGVLLGGLILACFALIFILTD